MHLGDLSQTHQVENIRRSIAMLSPGAPALNREEACTVLEALIAALRETKVGRDEAPPPDPSGGGQEAGQREDGRPVSPRS